MGSQETESEEKALSGRNRQIDRKFSVDSV